MNRLTRLMPGVKPISSWMGFILAVFLTLGLIIAPSAIATSGVRGCDNRSNASVSIVNSETPGDSKIVSPRTYNAGVYAWISQHRDKPLNIQTGRGKCSIWDSDWKIKGQWDDGSGEFELARVKRSTQDFSLIIADTGEISLQ